MGMLVGLLDVTRYAIATTLVIVGFVLATPGLLVLRLGATLDWRAPGGGIRPRRMTDAEIRRRLEVAPWS